MQQIAKKSRQILAFVATWGARMVVWVVMPACMLGVTLEAFNLWANPDIDLLLLPIIFGGAGWAFRTHGLVSANTARIVGIEGRLATIDSRLNDIDATLRDILAKL